MPNINVTYQEMRDASNKLNSGKEEILSKLQELRSMVSHLVADGYVTDKSSKRFDESYTEFNDGITKAAEGLQGMGEYLKSAADAMEQTDEQLATAISKK
jgi:WXG100 family type VII secretion target